MRRRRRWWLRRRRRLRRRWLADRRSRVSEILFRIGRLVAGRIERVVEIDYVRLEGRRRHGYRRSRRRGRRRRYRLRRRRRRRCRRIPEIRVHLLRFGSGGKDGSL